MAQAIAMTTAGQFSYYADVILPATGDPNSAADLTHNIYTKQPMIPKERQRVTIVPTSQNAHLVRQTAKADNSVSIQNDHNAQVTCTVYVEGVHSINL